MSGALVKRNYVAEFKQAFGSGVENLVKACHIYVEAIDENPKNKTLLVESCADFIPIGAWSGFEAVGRKWKHPKLIFGGGGVYGSKIAKLAYSDQEQIFEGHRFDLLVSDGKTLKVDVREVTPEQAEQLFNGTHIRNVAEQKAWMEARKAAPVVAVAEVMPYTITKKGVEFRRGVTLTKAEIRSILQEM